ncbi:hypothetical protein DRH29_00260 [candidate division Kazan bacterium]|uniref:M23ase beta-sheet core domain-containing protein n=1 Tax=candidate division Kazan bacterium TaxID=2202143 RepID=A0A420ZDV0_UNCK3|nr:MAG: hypothetical protein DRH29_00260 [candidate division Kazan bacterium]
MAKFLLAIIFSVSLVLYPTSASAPATGGDTLGLLKIAKPPINEAVVDLPVTPEPEPSPNPELDLIMPLAGPSIHTNYFGPNDVFHWQDINSRQYHTYGVENGKFIYQPGDTWFIYGLFGPIEAVKYDWNVKYPLWNGRHNGIDFAVASGTPVLAASGGEVTFVGERVGHSIVVQIDNFQITYGHLDSFLVKVGERVTQGQIIGYSGSSGTINPHLHFEIDKYENEQRWGINPAKYLLPELKSAIIPDVSTNRYINGPLLWENPAGDFRW